MTPLRNPTSIGLLIAILSLASPLALSQGETRDDHELAKTGIPDSTPQQAYDSAIHEAGGAYKMALTDCQALKGKEHADCLHDANATYRQDMADARTRLREAKGSGGHRP